MQYRENGINLLQELVQKLESQQYSLPAEAELIFENGRVDRAAIGEWKGKVDTLVREISIKWLDESVNLEDIMQTWAATLSEDPVFLTNFNKLGDILEKWKSALRDIFFKDTSIYTMPLNAVILEDEEIIGDQDRESTDRSKSEEIISDG